MARLSLTLLGGFQARLDTGEALGLPTRKAQALLAYLALPPGQAHPRDKLAALLWGGIREESARASLRQALFSIRKALGAVELEVLRQEGDALSLVPGAIEVDAAVFQQHVAEATAGSLEQAATLYRGDLLSGFALDESPFEEWLLGERERLRELALEGLARLLAQQRKAGANEAAVQTALRLLTLDPLQEAVHRALMRLYADLGRRGTALRQYQQCVAVLGRELGIEPEAETKTLYQEILKAPPSRRLEPVMAEAPTGGMSRAPAIEMPLIGRATELAALQDAFEQAQAGQGRVMAVLGEAGIGKTRLVAELIGEAEARGARVMVGRCYESEQVLPFGPWVDAFRGAPTVIEALKSSTDVLQVFEQVAAALMALAGNPALLVVFEDVHWADEMSLRLLACVGRRLAAVAALVVVTVRDEELADAAMLRRALDELQREHRLARLALTTLSRESTLMLVQTLSRSGTEAAALARLGEIAWRVSDGNPFVVVETVRSPAPAGGLTEPVRQLVTSRLDRLSERARLLTTVAAVIGREFEFTLLCRAAGLTEAQGAEGVEELVRRRVLQGVGERFDFTHDRIRDVALAGLLAPRRRVLHRSVAEAIEAVHAADLEPHALALGLHCHAAEMWPEALRHLRQAAVRAFAQSAFRESATCFERALDAASRLPQTTEILQQMLELQIQLRSALWPLAEFERIAGCLDEAERLATVLGDRGRLARTTATMSVLRWITGDATAARRLAHEAREMAVALDDRPLQAMANYYRGLACYLLAEYRDAEAAYGENVRMLAGARAQYRLGASSTLVMSAAWLVLPLAERGAFAEGLEHGRVALRLAEAAQDPYGIVTAAYCLGYLHCLKGELDAAQPLLERALAISREREFAVWLPQVTGVLGHVYAQGDRLDEGLALLDEAMGAYEATRAWPFRPLLTVHRGAGRLRVGRLAAALALGREALALAREHDERGHEAWALRLLGDIATQADPRDTKEAERCYRDAWALANGLGMRPLVAHCHLALGALSAGAGDAAGAREHRTAAVTLYREMAMPAWLARAEAALT
jgi:DNA-binding SARP family transcriptional activator